MNTEPRIYHPVPGGPGIILPRKKSAPDQHTTIPAPVIEADPFQMPAAAMYGYAAKIARATDAPLGWAYISTLTMIAGAGIRYRSEASECPPPRLYSCLLGDVHFGKSRTVDRVRKVVGIPNEATWLRETNLNSDRALDQEFPLTGPPPDTGAEAPSVVVYSDEMLTLLRKLCIQGSTLAAGLCSLFYRDSGSNSDRKGAHPYAVRLSILGCLKCKDPDDFRQTWQANTGEGLIDRMLIVPGPKKPHPFTDDWIARTPEFDSDDVDGHWSRPAEVPVTITLHDFDRITEWQRSGEGRERIAEIAKRCAIIAAAANNDTRITPECVAAALELARWQEKVRRVYGSSEAQTPDAVIASAILDGFISETKRMISAGAPHPYWITYRKISLNKNWMRKWGAAVTRSWQSLVTEGLLDQEMILQNDVSRPAKPTRLKVAFTVSPEDV